MFVFLRRIQIEGPHKKIPSERGRKVKDKQLFIPDKIHVGFQKRDDTYTKKLAYVIYYDSKGVLRKEKSWNNWRDSKIKDIIFENTPTEGFVLNKGVGGVRQSYGWNARNEYIRVYDPRDFEFEISVANLLFILKECDCSRGKGLEDKFVYSWDGTELVLLPVGSSDYKNSMNYTQLQSKVIKSKELIAGASYTTKKQDILVYLGRFDYHTLHYSKISCRKKYVFWDGKNFVFLNDLKSIAVLSSDTISEDYAELVTRYSKSINGSKIVKVFAKKLPSKKSSKKPQYYYYRENWVTEDGDNTWTMYFTSYDYQNKSEIHYINRISRISFKDKLVFNGCNEAIYNPEYTGQVSFYHKTGGKWIKPTGLGLYAQLESGSKFMLSNGSFGYF